MAVSAMFIRDMGETPMLRINGDYEWAGMVFVLE